MKPCVSPVVSVRRTALLGSVATRTSTTAFGLAFAQAKQRARVGEHAEGPAPSRVRPQGLFAGSHAGAERAAIAYSIIATCDLVDVSPVRYLADVLPKPARGVFTSAELAELTPAAWKKARAAAEVAPSPSAWSREGHDIERGGARWG